MQVSNTKQNTTKLLLLWDRMGDYHRARWDACKSLLGKENVFAVDFLNSDTLYGWEQTRETENYICLNHVSNKISLNKLKRYIELHKITNICIPGYGRTLYLKLLVWCRRKDLNVIMFAESWYPHRLSFIDKIKGAFIYRTANYIFASGERAKNHFSHNLNFPLHKIFTGYSVIDNEHFKNNNLSEVTNNLFFLSIARFAPEKNLTLLIKAFSKFVSQLGVLSSNIPITLKIIGGGPQKQELQQFIESLNMNDYVELHDWCSYKTLPDHYLNASCFVLASKFEPWGLVVNEAMAAGLPIICSDAVGAVPDLCKAENSVIFQSENENDLVSAFKYFENLSDIQKYEMGKHSVRIIEDYSCLGWAKKIEKYLVQ